MDRMLPSVRMLKQLNYKLYATGGTSDFYNAQGIAVHPVQKSFLSDDGIPSPSEINDIAKHLQELEIELVINLPMKSSGSQRVSTLGYRYRRFAVDYSIPLICDVKCAKLFVEALQLIHGYPTVKLQLDCLTALKPVRIPGLVDVHVHLREPGGETKEDFDSGTCAALAGGITLVGVMPNTSPAIVDAEALSLELEIAKKKARCDYALYMAATKDNDEELCQIARSTRFLAVKMYLNCTYGNFRMPSMSDWMVHFEKLPSNVSICCHAEKQTTAAVLFLAEKF